jgi:hypothetical protein
MITLPYIINLTCHLLPRCRLHFRPSHDADLIIPSSVPICAATRETLDSPRFACDGAAGWPITSYLGSREQKQESVEQVLLKAKHPILSDLRKTQLQHEEQEQESHTPF